MADPALEKAKRFLGEYLLPRKILIVDPNGPARAGMARMLVGLGAKSSNLTLVADYEVAREVIHNDCPDVIITEYTITKGTGLELAYEFNKFKRNENTLFVILTANSSQSVVAQAAEEDVDIYILKPYTMNYFLETLSKAAQLKINPTDYVRKITLGKKKLAENNLEEALQYFEKAITYSTTPSLAYYYRSQIEMQKKMYDLAEKSLEEGLSFNEVHYKCLTGLFDLLLEQEKHHEAYGIVKRMAAFPLNPKRLSKVIELAVKTAHYSDIEKYYEAFKEIESRDLETVKHICAALIVSGKKLFQRGELYKAASFLKKASISAAGRPNILLEIVFTLSINSFLPDAKEVLNRFPPETQQDYQYQVASFLISYYDGGNSWQYVTWLRKSIEQHGNDPTLFYWIIAALNTSNKIDLADDYMARAKNKWPDQFEYFESAVKAIPPKKSY